jgi:hypothetical protein
MDGRHHHAVHVIFVETPVAGSPKPVDARRPPAYPHQRREYWRPRTRPPSVERVIEFMRRVQKQDNEVRAFMRRASHPARVETERQVHA